MSALERHHDLVQLRIVVVLIALLAMVRIIVDAVSAEPATVLGLPALTRALGAVYWLAGVDRLSQTANKEPFGDEHIRR